MECEPYLHPGESDLYLGTSLFLLRRPGGQGPWERHAEGWKTAKNRQAIRGLEPTLCLTHKYILELLLTDGACRSGREKGGWALAVSRDWWDAQGADGGCRAHSEQLRLWFGWSGRTLRRLGGGSFWSQLRVSCGQSWWWREEVVLGTGGCEEGCRKRGRADIHPVAAMASY